MMILHYTFERMDEDIILDESGYNNNARLVAGELIYQSPDIRH